jgi:hypothetical protein
VRYENGDLLAYSHVVLNRRKSYFSQLLNVLNVSDVSQLEIDTAEPLASGPSCLEIGTAASKLKKYKLLGSGHIPSQLIDPRGKMLLTLNHKLINSFWNEEELPGQWKDPVIVPFHKKGDKTDCSTISFIDNFIRYPLKKNAVLWDVTLCGSCENRRFGGTCRLHHHLDKNRWARINVSSN